MSVITELLILKMPPYILPHAHHILPHAPPMHTTWTPHGHHKNKKSCSSRAAHMPLTCTHMHTHMQLTCNSHALTCHSHAAHIHSHATHMQLTWTSVCLTLVLLFTACLYCSILLPFTHVNSTFIFCR